VLCCCGCKFTLKKCFTEILRSALQKAKKKGQTVKFILFNIIEKSVAS
jgi:hypothetical protein